MSDPDFFDLFHHKYRESVNSESSSDSSQPEDIPPDFPSESATWLPDAKANYARKKVHKKVKHLVSILYPKAEGEDRKKYLQEVYKEAYRKNGVRPNGFISYREWEKIYEWLIDRIAHAQDLKGTEDI